MDIIAAIRHKLLYGAQIRINNYSQSALDSYDAYREYMTSFDFHDNKHNRVFVEMNGSFEQNGLTKIGDRLVYHPLNDIEYAIYSSLNS